MKHTRHLLLAVFSGLTFSSAPLGAAVLVEYKFDSNATVYDPTVSDSNLSAGDFTLGSGIGGTNITSAVAQSGRSLFSSNAGFYQTTPAGAFGQKDHLSFTVTVASGFQADLTSLDFYTLRGTSTVSGAGAPSSFAIYSSDDNFATSTLLDSGSNPNVGTSTFTAHSADVSSLQNLTGTTEFRMVFWVDAIATPSEREWRLDDVSLRGTVEAVPEPSNAALLALMLGLVFLRRHRS